MASRGTSSPGYPRQQLARGLVEFPAKHGGQICVNRARPAVAGQGWRAHLIRQTSRICVSTMPGVSPGPPPAFARSPLATNRMLAYHKRRASSSCCQQACEVGDGGAAPQASSLDRPIALLRLSASTSDMHIQQPWANVMGSAADWVMHENLEDLGTWRLIRLSAWGSPLAGA